MKKLIIPVLIMFLIGTGAATYFQFTLSTDELYANGTKIDTPMYKLNGVNYIPVKKAADALGVDVTYEDGKVSLTSRKELSVEDVAKNVESTVLVRVYNSSNMSNAKLISMGSGVVLENNIIVTNKHVTQNGFRYGISYSNTEEGKEYRSSAQLNPFSQIDINILDSPDTTQKAAKLGDSDTLKQGQKVVAIGSPLGMKNTVSEGVISGFRTIYNQKYIQITAQISPGSSGGGLYDMYGNLVGITTASVKGGEDLNLAIPINDVKKILKDNFVKTSISIHNKIKGLTFNGEGIFFETLPYYLDKYFHADFDIFEEVEGTEVIEKYLKNTDFKKLLKSKVKEIAKEIEEYGYRSYYIRLWVNGKLYEITCTNGESKETKNTLF
jgi:S1-C subfamily serine protease